MRCGLLVITFVAIAGGILSVPVRLGVERTQEHTQAHVNTHALAQFLTSDEGWVYRFSEGEK